MSSAGPAGAEGAGEEGDRRLRRRRVVLWVGFAVLTGLITVIAVLLALSLDGFSVRWWLVLGTNLALQVGMGVGFGLYMRPPGIVDSLRGLTRRQRRRLDWAETTGRVVDDPAVARVALERAEVRLSGLRHEHRAVTLIVRGVAAFVLVAALCFVLVATVVWYRGDGVDLLLLGFALAVGLFGSALPRVVRAAQRRDARRLERVAARWREVAE